MKHIQKGERSILEEDLAGLRRQRSASHEYLRRGNLDPSVRRALVERIPYLDSAIERLSTRLASGRLREDVPFGSPACPEAMHHAARYREATLR